MKAIIVTNNKNAVDIPAIREHLRVHGATFDEYEIKKVQTLQELLYEIALGKMNQCQVVSAIDESGRFN